MNVPDRPTAAAWLQSHSPQPALIVTGVPWDAGRGGATTPGAVRRALERFSTFHSEAEVDLAALDVGDAGDWGIDGSDPATASAEIEAHSGRLDPAHRHAFLGGDPAVTRPVVNGLGTATQGLLTFSGSLRVGAAGGEPNGTTISGLLEDGLPGERIAQVGVHGFGNPAADHSFCDEHGISLYPMDTIDLWGVEETVTVALDHLASTCERIYVNFDVNVLDAAQAPGAPDSRPGGLTARQLATAAFLCGRHPLVHAADFVGVDTGRDHHDLTVMNLANAFVTFAGGLASRRTTEP